MTRQEAYTKACRIVNLEMEWHEIVVACAERGITIIPNRAETCKRLIDALTAEMTDQPQDSDKEQRIITEHTVTVENGRYSIYLYDELVGKGKCSEKETTRQVFDRAMLAFPEYANVNKPVTRKMLIFQQQTGRWVMHAVWASWAVLEISQSDLYVDSFWLKYRRVNAAHTQCYQFPHKKPRILVADRFCQLPKSLVDIRKSTGIAPFDEIEAILKNKDIEFSYL